MKHILILEDNRSTRNALRKAIEELGGKNLVYAAASLDEARRILYDVRIDLFILDIILTTETPGDTSGIRFAEQIRQMDQYKFTPVIFITALADPELYAYRCLHSYAYLEKPFRMAEAVELIQNALEFPSLVETKNIEYFRKDGILIAVDLAKVMYAEVCLRRMTFHLPSETIEIPYMTIKRFLERSRMPEHVQCNRYTVVNMAYVKMIDPARRLLTLHDGTVIEIGAAYLKKLRVMR